MKFKVLLRHQVSYAQQVEVEVEASDVCEADSLVEEMFLEGKLDNLMEVVDEDSKEYYEIFSKESE